MATERVPPLPPPPMPSATRGEAVDVYDRVKVDLHRRLVDKLDLASLERLGPAQLREEIASLVAQELQASHLPLNRREREQMVQDLMDDILGLGPLEPLLRDPTISDILVNTHTTVYVERFGRLEQTSQRFRDAGHLMQTIQRIVSRIGRRVDESSPMVDARLVDGSRVNAIIPPLAVDGPVLCIRRFGVNPLRIPDLLRLETLTETMVRFIEGAVRARLNILISGGTGSGKTTLLNAMSSFIPASERIVTIEDAAELQLQQPHVVRLETRPPNVEGRGEVVARDLVRNSLRMRPDRIIVGEVRGAEVLDMLQAMNTGHEGSLTTVHANSARDAIGRLVNMIGLAGIQMSDAVASQTIARALDVIVHVQRGIDGRRRVMLISEVTGVEGTVVQLQDVFVFRQLGVDASSRVLGEFSATGIRPRCMDRLERAGVRIEAETFMPQSSR